MNFVPFVFVDNWKFISYLGEHLFVNEKDLQNYRENGLTDSEIKSMIYSYLTSNTISDLQKPMFQSYEF